MGACSPSLADEMTARMGVPWPLLGARRERVRGLGEGSVLVAPARLARGTGRAGRLPRGPFAGLVALAECSPPRAPRCAAFAAPQLASRGRLPALSSVPRAPRPNAARPPDRSLRRLRPLAAAGPARASIPRQWGRVRRSTAGLRPRRPAVRRQAARIRPPHPSESARSAPGPRGLRRLCSRPRRPTGGRGGLPPCSFFQNSREAARGTPDGGGRGD